MISSYEFEFITSGPSGLTELWCGHRYVTQAESLLCGIALGHGTTADTTASSDQTLGDI